MTADQRLCDADGSHMFDAVGHGVSAGAAQGDVQHHDLIGCDEGSDTHDEDQVPGGRGEEGGGVDIC